MPEFTSFMQKRYQVFVSSTYVDLQEERQEVMQALLELDCIPAGMELFPAANDDQWSLIKKVIDDCDYYLVIIGGRYGSVGDDGVSYTEKEYRYAIEKNKPIIAFLVKDPGDLPSKKCEQKPEAKDKLESFRSLVQLKMVKYWTSPIELGSVVSRSLIKLISSNPAIGWVKADRILSESATEEILRLKTHIEDLESVLASSQIAPPESAKGLASGDDIFTINFEYTVQGDTIFDHETYQDSFETTWNNIFAAIGPLMIDEASENDLKKALGGFTYSQNARRIQKTLKDGTLRDPFKTYGSEFQTIKIQLRALGLIMKNSKPRSVKNTSTYWTLTPYGDSVLTQLRAIKKPPRSK